MKNPTPLGKMLGNRTRYIIPFYQRGYSWKSKQVKEFLEDLEQTVNKNNDIYTHFFGTMITTDPNNPNCSSYIIDGQQRMTTAVLFLICARNFFYMHKDSSSRAKDHHEFIEKHIYPMSHNDNKYPNEFVLELSDTNKEFFQELLEHKPMVHDIGLSKIGLNDSNKLLYAAYNKIRDWFKKKYNSRTSEKQDMEPIIEKLYRYVTALFQKFVIYNILCDDEFDAQRIFNLVNNRGIRLSSSDLIKNLFFSKLSENQKHIEARNEAMKFYIKYWDDMRNHITCKRAANYRLDRFFHHYLLVFYSDTLAKITENHDRISPNGIYNSYYCLLDNGFQAEDMIKDMREWSHILDRLRNPYNANWNNNDNIIHYLTKLQNIDAVTVYPAILAGYNAYWKAGQTKQFEALVMLCFKYHIRIKTIGTAITIDDYQNKIHEIMNLINNKKLMHEIIENLSSDPKHYPDKSIVQPTLNQYVVHSTKLSLALLEEAEYIKNRKRSPHDTSIEHIMPVKLNPHWRDYIKRPNNPSVSSSDDIEKFHKQYLPRLGNLTLLSSKKNNPLSNKPYNEKRKAYINDKTFKINEMFTNAEFDTWNLAAINERQERLAEDIIQAIDITKIPSLINLK